MTHTELGCYIQKIPYNYINQITVFLSIDLFIDIPHCLQVRDPSHVNPKRFSWTVILMGCFMGMSWDMHWDFTELMGYTH